MSAVLPSRLLPITPSSFGGRKPQRGSLSCRGDGKSTFLEDDSGLLSFTRITANHFERQTWSWKKNNHHNNGPHLGNRNKHPRVSAAFCETVHTDIFTQHQTSTPCFQPKPVPLAHFQGAEERCVPWPRKCPKSKLLCTLLSSFSWPARGTRSPNLLYSDFTSHQELQMKK